MLVGCLLSMRAPARSCSKRRVYPCVSSSSRWNPIATAQHQFPSSPQLARL
jgi:hypothetical protein